MREGYKETKLGWIPEEWVVKKFTDFASRHKKWSITGGPFGSDLKTSDYAENGVRIIQLQNIGDGAFIDDYKIFTSIQKADKLISSNIYPGDIILSKMGEPVARACFIPNTDNRYVMASDGIRLSIDERTFDSKFVHDYINSSFFRKSAKKVSTGSTRQRIGLPILKKLDVICPPLSEQKVIADCLSIWDRSIEIQTKLIKSKKERRKALMQQLLTGKIRLKGFEKEKGNHSTKLGLQIPCDWKIIKVKDLFEERKETSDDQLKFPLFSLTIEKGITNKTDRYERSFLLRDQESNLYKLVYPNDIVFNPMNLRFGSIAKSTLNIIVSVSAYYNSLKTKINNVDINYYEALFKTPLFINFYDRIAIGSLNEKKRVHLSNFLELDIPYPSFEEQNAIVAILNTAEKEIKMEKLKLVDLQKQKKGLMQQLLTGKVRLV
ncbi:restriction endonuclease subunit S [Flavobacterium chungbukense]|uniref:Type I restriction modification DNA specificity domain-containing protein n=1 Tax=Flavobacterium chungbukense TaxID=877464 RepID=A0ABP7XVD2_9FLAO|nr:restriction endonuclease subunit S [Flavobacterium chungbukense]MCC4921597.1 restriction endonuclease subunit S [Flavobacterium chungbukense]